MTRMPVAERRELLLTAAWRVLVERGFGAATTRAICAEAGMPQGAFHYCFTGRDELLREVAAGLLGELTKASTGAVSRQGSIQEAILLALLAYWESVETTPGAHQVLYEITTAVLRDEANADIARSQYERYLQAVVQTLETVGEIRNVDWDTPLAILARLIVSVLDGLTLSYLVDRDTEAARAVLDNVAADLATHAKRRRR